MNAWDRRIARAQQLEADEAYAVARDLLHFYIEIARYQKGLAHGDHPPPPRTAEPIPPALLDRIVNQAQVLRLGPQETLSTNDSKCPVCKELPVAGVLRPEGEGGRRSLVCSLCYAEWGFRRLLCPNCGEENQEKLGVYTQQKYPHVRVEACDSCRTYLKCIDMTRNGLAVPEVDEIATVSLDAWAAGNNFIKLQTNILGL